MNGPRGTFVIALLFLIAAEIAWVGSAITGNGSWVGGLMLLCFVIALVRVFVELFREGQADADAAKAKRRIAAPGRSERMQAPKPREFAPERTDAPAKAEQRAPLEADGGTNQLDPQKRRPPHS